MKHKLVDGQSDKLLLPADELVVFFGYQRVEIARLPEIQQSG